MLKYVCLMNIFNSLKHMQHFNADNFKKKKKKEKNRETKKKNIQFSTLQKRCKIVKDFEKLLSKI